MESLTVRQIRRLALIRAGLFKRHLTGLPRRASGRGQRARRAAEAIIRRFGYLQLDTVSIAGARSHAIVLHSRLDNFEADFAEELLQPGSSLFEYWGHEACWMPLELFSTFAFRRRQFRRHPWWGDLISAHPEVARNLKQRIRDEGPLRSLDMEGRGSRGWWNLKLSKRIATALWSCGELAIRERRAFQRTFDLTERVIPDHLRHLEVPEEDALETLTLAALEGHGWATQSTIVATWRLSGRSRRVGRTLERLEQQGLVCRATVFGESKLIGWIRRSDLDLVTRLDSFRPRSDRGVLLSPFDPILWDRRRVAQLFGFDQILEIFKPAKQRRYGYYCLPVLAGERLVARVDLKAHRREQRLEILSIRYEDLGGSKRSKSKARAATRSALERYAKSVGLELTSTHADT